MNERPRPPYTHTAIVHIKHVYFALTVARMLQEKAAEQEVRQYFVLFDIIFNDWLIVVFTGTERNCPDARNPLGRKPLNFAGGSLSKGRGTSDGETCEWPYP